MGELTLAIVVGGTIYGVMLFDSQILAFFALFDKSEEPE